jgi:hypothetical protein
MSKLFSMQRVSRRVTSVTGYEIRRAYPRRGRAVPAGGEPGRTAPDPRDVAALAARVGPHDRLVPAPAFILSSVRSGSTLLRLMLDTHSQVCSPHELHLGAVRTQIADKFALLAMEEIELDTTGLRYLLWDRLLHRELQRSGKQVLVNKTPRDALIWRNIAACWPQARFIFLLRNPASIVDSWNAARTHWTREETTRDVLRYLVAVEEARTMHGGLTVKYEDVTTDPEGETRRICEFLGLDWEPAMLRYGNAEHGGMVRGLGDWSPAVESGEVQRHRPLPSADAVPPPLRPLAQKWGYLP